MLYLVLGSVGVLLLAYLVLVNYGMQRGAANAYQHASRWTEAEIKEAAERVSENPPDFLSHLPPAQDRRYIIVGGSGFVGGCIARHLILRGQSPDSLRIVDVRKPAPVTLANGHTIDLPFVPCDIRSLDSTMTAFSTQWPDKWSQKPLTVFHTAAIIRPADRSSLVLPISESINVDGTKHVIEAAEAVHADILIATASATIDIRAVNFWLPIDRGVPANIVQVSNDGDKNNLVRPHASYFANYGYTKAKAEKLVLTAHGQSIKTGCLRPTVVYGSGMDLLIAPILDRNKIETWFSDLSISCIHVENASLAHLLFESTLLDPRSTSGGKSYVISDAGPPVRYGDMHKVLCTLNTDLQCITLPPVLMLMVAHCIEFYVLARARWLLLASVLPDVPSPINLLQPAAFSSCNIHQIADTRSAALSVEQGGIGYKPVCNALEGLCMQVLRHNEAMHR